MKHKQYEAEVKALVGKDDAPGTFDALVSVFDNIDSTGDRVKAGAFSKSIDSLRATGKRLPIVWAHKAGDPMSILGSAAPEDVVETSRGLRVKGVLDVADNPVAAQVYRLLKSNVISQFSFAYIVRPGGEKKAADGAYDLTDLEILEAGPCLRGVNSATELLAVKAETREHVKAYANIEIEGTYEERQDDLREALCAAYPADSSAPDARGPWVSLVGTTDGDVVYQLTTPDGETECYRVTYTVADDGSIALGEPEAVAFKPVPDTDESTEKSEPEPDVVEPEAKTEPEAPAAKADLSHDEQVIGMRLDLAAALAGAPLDIDALDARSLNERLRDRLGAL